MKFQIKATISLKTSLSPDHLVSILEPENETPNNTSITSFSENERVVTIIEGFMKIGSVLRSIDDIIKTANLTEEIHKTTKDLT